MVPAKRPWLSLIVLCLGSQSRPGRHQPAEPANPKKEGPLS